MKNLKRLSKEQINKIISESQTELNRRKNIDAATLEIRSVLERHNIAFEDIDVKKIMDKSLTVRSNKKTKIAKPTDQRRSVKAKYRDPNGKATWTGRGRSPGWVTNICQKEGIDIKTFKNDDRFKC